MRTYKENAELFFEYLSNHPGKFYKNEYGDDVVIVLSDQGKCRRFTFVPDGQVHIYAEESCTIAIPGLYQQYTDTIDASCTDFNKFCDWYSSNPQTSYGRSLFAGYGATEDVLKLKENN